MPLLLLLTIEGAKYAEKIKCPCSFARLVDFELGQAQMKAYLKLFEVFSK